MARPPVNAAQLEVLRWVADGCPAEGMTGEGHKTTARALESRRLVKVSRKGGVWRADLTDDGRYYLDHQHYPDPPPDPEGDEPGPCAGVTATERLVTRQAKRVAAGRARTPAEAAARLPRRPRAVPSSTRLEPVTMRYKIVISRVQTAERHVRAASEEDALAKVQAELEKPYGFLGGWVTVDTDMDIVEAVSPLGTGPQQITQADGGFLLTIKAAAKYLGLSYSSLYELVNRGEIGHLLVGSRRYISRDQMTAFIDGHSHKGYVRS